MTKPVVLLIASIVCFELADWVFGYQTVYQVGYGAFAILAGVIALTFLWLWARRSTPLALGMAFGWAGASSVMAWWWLFNLLDRPEGMVDNALLFVFPSVYFVGAVLHLDVIGRSFGLSRVAAHAPIAGALLCSILRSVVF